MFVTPLFKTTMLADRGSSFEASGGESCPNTGIHLRSVGPLNSDAFELTSEPSVIQV